MYKVGNYVKLTSLRGAHYLEGEIIQVSPNKAPCDFTIAIKVAQSCRMHRVGSTADIITDFYVVEVV